MQCLFCAAEGFFLNRFLSSGERDSCFFVCASASVCKILIFFSGGRKSRCVLCAVHQHHCIKLFFLSGESDCLKFCCSAAFVIKICSFLSGKRDS